MPTTVKKKRKSKYDIETYDLRPKRSFAGIGLFTYTPIKKGKCVIEYVGRTISEEEEYTSRSKYLFEVTKKKTIDGRPKINKAGYINHSCRPNCEPETYKGRVFIMARRNIKEGEELTYDYGKAYWNEHIGKEHCRCEKCAEKRAQT
jgi:SET domain-containing protein